MSKINVLCIPSDRSGVGKFRSVEPHVFLQQKYPDDFFVEIDYQPPFDNLDFYKKYQIYHLNNMEDYFVILKYFILFMDYLQYMNH